jgi:hypothetical protein
MIKRHIWSSLPQYRIFVWTDPDPVDFTIYPISLSLDSNAANADDRVEYSISEGSHAILSPKAAILVGITVVSPLVYQYSLDTTCWL